MCEFGPFALVQVMLTWCIPPAGLLVQKLPPQWGRKKWKLVFVETAFVLIAVYAFVVVADVAP